MIDRSSFLPGATRRFNNHSVCKACGAMVDNEFLDVHAGSHADPSDGAPEGGVLELVPIKDLGRL